MTKKAMCTVIESTEIKIFFSRFQENQHKLGKNQHLLHIYKSNMSQKQGQGIHPLNLLIIVFV